MLVVLEGRHLEGHQGVVSLLAVEGMVHLRLWLLVVPSLAWLLLLVLSLDWLLLILL